MTKRDRREFTRQKFTSNCIAGSQAGPFASNVFRRVIHLLFCWYFVVDLFIHFPSLFDEATARGMQAAAASGNAHAIAQHSYADSHSAVRCTCQLMPPCVYITPGALASVCAFASWCDTRRLSRISTSDTKDRTCVHRPRDEKPTEPTHWSVNTKWICMNELSVCWQFHAQPKMITSVFSYSLLSFDPKKET